MFFKHDPETVKQLVQNRINEYYAVVNDNVHDYHIYDNYGYNQIDPIKKEILDIAIHVAAKIARDVSKQVVDEAIKTLIDAYYTDKNFEDDLGLTK